MARHRVMDILTFRLNLANSVKIWREKNNASKICKSGEEDIFYKQIYIYHHRAIFMDRQFYSTQSVNPEGGEGMGMVGGFTDKHDIVKVARRCCEYYLSN